MQNSVVVIDNGAYTIKTGVVHGENPVSSRIIPNSVVRSKGDKATYFGHEFERCKDYSSLHYRLPFEKGFLVDWDAQKAVWDGLFSDEVFGVDTTEATLLITEPYFNLPNIQEIYDQFIFEEYEFQSYYRCTAASLMPHSSLFSIPESIDSPDCMVVVDSGFSFTHVVPIWSGKVIWSAVKRLDVGGKLLTNQLKELVSFRQWNMMDETYIMNHVKESCCYVSQNFKGDLEKCTRADPKSNPIVQEYILPDLSTNRKGHIRQPDDIVAENDQILVMNNERFTIPEIIFRPDDIGLDQSGLAGSIASSIAMLPEDLQGMFWANIGLIGGSTKFPGFRTRLESELQSLAPVDCEVSIYECDDPITEAYRAALSLVATPEFSGSLVTRSEYMESGSNASRRKFQDWKSPDPEKEKPKDTAKNKGREKEDDRTQSSSRLARTRSKTQVSTTASGRKR